MLHPRSAGVIGGNQAPTRLTASSTTAAPRKSACSGPWRRRWPSWTSAALWSCPSCPH